MNIPTSVQEFFRNRGGFARRGELLPALMSARTLQKYMEQEIIQRWGRGMYRLREDNLPDAPEMLMVARKYPASVICLVSALSFHDLTTQIPHAVDIAIPYRGNAPKSTYPLIRTYRFRDAIYEAGIDIQDIQGVPLKVYNKEKTLVDVFRFRNRIGMDVFLEALNTYAKNYPINLPLLHEYAALRGVSRTIMPYLETLV